MPVTARTYLQRKKIPARPLLPEILADRSSQSGVKIDHVGIQGVEIPRYTDEFWTSRQRQASSLHEISYRACFKPQLARFFIERLSRPADVVYDPFMGRGTTLVEAALLGRRVIGNDINRLSKILAEVRLGIPNPVELEQRIDRMPLRRNGGAEIDLSLFYHPKTEREIIALRKYLARRRSSKKEDDVDRWIRMVGIERLHPGGSREASEGFEKRERPGAGSLRFQSRDDAR